MKKRLVKIISLFSVFVLLCCPVLHSFANALSATAEVVSAKVDPEVMAAFADGAETVEVYVWLNDIDQKQVDAIVEQKTGLRADNLAVIDENISDVLAARIVSEADRDSLTDETEKLLQAYLDRTAAQRTQERERTDLYISTRRAEAKAKYNQKSTSFLSKNAISSEKVIFNSNYAPMLILELTKQEVKSIAARADVESVSIVYDSDEKVDENQLAQELEIAEVTRIKNISGLTGENVKIGMVETYSIDSSQVDVQNVFGTRHTHLAGYQTGYGSHSFGVASIMAGIDGIANDAILYSVGTSANDPSTTADDDNNYNVDYYGRVEQLITAGANVINKSAGTVREELPSYNNRCKWVDHIVSQHGISFVASAGNYGTDSDHPGYVLDPAVADNVITVGAYHLEGDEESGYTKKLAAYSSYEEGTAVSKPDVVGLGKFAGYGRGTSNSAPFVTGIIALILELRPSLSAYPHVVKSIIMASCHEKALPAIEGETAETMTAGLTEKQGAGIVNPYIAVAIASHGTYGFGVLESEISTERVKFQQSIAGSGAMNVVVTWLREVEASGTGHSSGAAEASARRDLDIRLVSNGSIIGYSTKSNTSAEMVYTNFTNGANNNYEIVANRFGSSTEDIRYAYAWSVNSMRFQYNQPFEGIGYLKNLNSSYYMEADTTALTMSQQTFDGDFNQMWILRRNANASTYKLQSAYGTIGSVADSSSISNSSASVVTVSLNDDGTYSFIQTNGTTQYILGISNNATTAGAVAVWQLKGDTVSDSQKWYFELCAYERGDYDKNGTINAEDARMILRASAGTETPDTMQAFLSDIDGNGALNSMDARLANRYAAGLDP